jgi:hypothetical protein
MVAGREYAKVDHFLDHANGNQHGSSGRLIPVRLEVRRRCIRRKFQADFAFGVIGGEANATMTALLARPIKSIKA